MTLITGKISTDGKGGFVDEEGRTVNLRGVNLDGGSKFPYTPNFPTYRSAEEDNGLFFEGDHVSFVGRPYPVHEVAVHIERIKSLGYNSIRYIITWEAIEHEGPGIYDEEFIKYTVDVLKVIREVGGVYVYIDPHQDVWSRYCGGDGAPLWTLYAAGFDPKKFNANEAAILQNYFPPDPRSYPDMLWPTNYRRLAAGTMFALFFCGKTHAPNATINGKNIQDYLQGHFTNAIQYFIKGLYKLEPSLFDELILGVESMNEPNSGYITIADASKVPDEQNLRRGTCPNIFESLKLGMGIKTEVEEYEISIFGVRKIGTKIVDPKGVTAWLDDDSYDKHYGFKRNKDWKLGECIWAQNGVWDIEKQDLLMPEYFGINPRTGEKLDERAFINIDFVDFYKDYKAAIRAVLPQTIMFLQPPTLQIPPHLKGTDVLDNNTVFCPHYYDGMTLMFRTWNRWYNVDTLGIIRGRYRNPIFGIVFGETAIRKSFRKQLYEMKLESEDNLGKNIPIVFSEIGMPMCLNERKAYKDENFSEQTDAIDAFGYALEHSNLSFTWWCYTGENSHKWGDKFNNEDFSVWSKDNYDGFNYPKLVTKRQQLKFKELPTDSTVDTANSSIFDSNNDTPETSLSLKSDKGFHHALASIRPSHNGFRAIDAVTRPYPISISGKFIDSEFNLKDLEYSLEINGDTKNLPTRIYLPQWHFPSDEVNISVTSGSFTINDDSEVLEWVHGNGHHKIKLKNISSPKNEGFVSSLVENCCSVFTRCWN